ncbi:MAG: autotransporter domain-containing protein [Rhizobiaceae bacterium]
MTSRCAPGKQQRPTCSPVPEHHGTDYTLTKTLPGDLCATWFRAGSDKIFNRWSMSGILRCLRNSTACLGVLPRSALPCSSLPILKTSSLKTSSLKTSRLKACLLMFPLLLLAPTGLTHAADVNWDGGGDGQDWFDPANWDTDAVPSSVDLLSLGISANGPAEVVISGDNSSFDANAQLVSVGFTTELSTLTIREGGRLIVHGYGDLAGAFYVGSTNEHSNRYFEQRGRVLVTGAGSLLEAEESISVGFGSEGSLFIENGALVRTPNMRVAVNYYSRGTLIVSGADDQGNASTLEIMAGPRDYYIDPYEQINFISVGIIDNTQGIILVEKGGVIRTKATDYIDDLSFQIGYLETAMGHVVVTGTGSRLQDINDLYVGVGGQGTLVVSDGGYVNTTYASVEGTNGLLLVTGVDSQGNASKLDIYGEANGIGLNIGAVGETGTVVLSNGGVIDVKDGTTQGNPGVVDLANGHSATGTIIIGAALEDHNNTPDIDETTSAAPGTLMAASVDFGDGAATLIFNHTDTSGTYGFNPDLNSTGDGAHRIDHHAGYTNLNGDGSGFNGLTTISGGTLAVNGDFSGTIFVENGGVLAGTGLIYEAEDDSFDATVQVLSGGTVSPGNTITSVGELSAEVITFNEGAYFDVEIGPNGESDLLLAFAATLGDGTDTGTGGTVRVKGGYSLTAQGIVSGSPFTILKAGDGITGTFEGVESSLFLEFELEYEDDANIPHIGTDTVLLTATRTAGFGDFANTPNEQAVGDALDTVGEQNDAVDALAVLTNENEARNALDALSGEIHSSTSGLIIEQGSRRQQIITNLLNQTNDSGENGDGNNANTYGLALPHGDGGGETTTQNALRWWASVGTERGTVDATSNTAALDTSHSGFLIGVHGGDSTTSSSMAWNLGIVGGYGASTIDQDSGATDTDTWSVGGYGRGSFGNTSLNLGTFYNWHTIDSQRSVAFGSLSEQLQASYKARTWQGFVELSHGFQINDINTLRPFAGISHIAMDSDGFTETGGSAALTAPSESLATSFTTLGLRSSHKLETETMSAVLHTMAGWRHGFGDIDPTTSFTLADSDSFTISGAPIAEDAFIAHLGLAARLNNKVSLSLSWDGQFSASTASNGINAKLFARF